MTLTFKLDQHRITMNHCAKHLLQRSFHSTVSSVYTQAYRQTHRADPTDRSTQTSDRTVTNTELLSLCCLTHECLPLVFQIPHTSTAVLSTIQFDPIQYNTKFVKRHVAVASEALANRSVKKHRRRRTNVL